MFAQRRICYSPSAVNRLIAMPDGSGPDVAEPPPLLETSPAALLHELFERQAEARPAQPALVCAGESVSYADLERRANQLARFLRKLGVGRGDCVGLLLPRSLEVYVALLGILKAGAAYVPLDPDYPAERVGFILSDCQARALVTARALAAKANAVQRPGCRVG